jgi:hypothetical protein
MSNALDKDEMTVEVIGPGGQSTGPMPAKEFHRRVDAFGKSLKRGGKRRTVSEPIQKPLEQWTEHRLAQAGMELAERLTELRRMESQEAARRKEFKEDHETALEHLHDLKRRIEEQRSVLDSED